jgi:hypothetical protein
MTAVRGNKAGPAHIYVNKIGGKCFTGSVSRSSLPSTWQTGGSTFGYSGSSIQPYAVRGNKAGPAFISIFKIAGKTFGLSSSSAALVWYNQLGGSTFGESCSSAALSTVAPPSGAGLIFRVSPQQPITRRQDYAGGKFWQRRVSARQSTVRMP